MQFSRYSEALFSAHDGMMGLKGITVSNDRNNLPPYIYGNLELENRGHTGGLRSWNSTLGRRLRVQAPGHGSFLRLPLSSCVVTKSLYNNLPLCKVQVTCTSIKIRWDEAKWGGQNLSQCPCSTPMYSTEWYVHMYLRSTVCWHYCRLHHETHSLDVL